MNVTLSMSADQHASLANHLFPGDGLEAAALLLCGGASHLDRYRLSVREVIPLDHAACKRLHDRISWPTDLIVPHLDHAEELGLSVIKVHCHPGGFPRFSDVDDAGDGELLPIVRSWVGTEVPHGSIVMLPNGRLFGRYLWRGDQMHTLDMISVAGPDMRLFPAVAGVNTPLFGRSQDQAFGDGTTALLGKLRAGIVGISGTGSPLLEQLIRLGFGEIVIIDPDIIEDRNLNRILNSSVADARAGRLKVDVAEASVAATGLPTKIIKVPSTLMSPAAIDALSVCDVIFGCVDTHTGRFAMNLVSTYHIIPYFDVGVMLDAAGDGETAGRIRDIFGTVHYIVPGRSSLISRDVISLQTVAAEGLANSDPEAAAQQVRDKYFRGLTVNRPAVISINMFAAALAVNDFLARIHPYRHTLNRDVGSIEFSLGQLRLTADEEQEDCALLRPWLGHGRILPLLGLPELSERRT
ncbi:ThiF family adenylyltransferase [Agrobacterium tumefaciens]|uniref:ThiF family adenylyltransferase n=1 Tax=Agrobacterium tumefaciens TaxID=358 RepID=UPI0015739D9E|nr:ThiF family adenylyltransferase [Agrobacterium tumefaciens]MCZ7497299.1 ThiF family adenylyltransferase [Rhizobium rhizogenes]NTE56514.1 ThiF family adenylyltransferase [Agrobacterium tumefaciens]NTE74482.1 ThiF family adenylyltransferase [Agrobacterium tumefaciens]